MLTVERMLTPLQVTHQVPGQDDKIFTIEDMEGGDDNKGYVKADEIVEKVLCFMTCKIHNKNNNLTQRYQFC